MNSTQVRNYNCKDEELPVICNYALSSLKRDAVDFLSYSPKFSETYIGDFETKIEGLTDLIEPKSETVQLKNITDGTYNAMDALIDPLNRVIGYIKLGNLEKSISVVDFGLTALRKSINSRDAEGVLKSLHTVNVNLLKYKTELMAQGLTDELLAKFTGAETLIAQGKQKQYEIVSNRRGIVQNNCLVCNEVYAQLTEILTVGKILYKATDNAKLQDYSFNELKKMVNKTRTLAKATAPEVKNTAPQS